jgi:tetratricopeptide (TPR) repeat protein
LKIRRLRFLRFKRVLACLAPLICLLASCGGDPLAIRQKCVANGNNFYNKGKYKEASILYRRALQLDPKYADAWYRLGLTALKLGDATNAAGAFRRAYSLDPSNGDACVRLADVYARAGMTLTDAEQRKRAAEMLSPLVDHLRRTNPRSFDALRLSGYLALLRRDVKTAIEDFRAANDVNAWQPDVVLVLAENLAMNGRTDEAAQLGEQTLEKNRDAVSLYSFLYALYVRTHHLDSALQVLQKRVKSLPDDGPARLQLALHYYATGQKQQMLDALQSMRNDRNILSDADGLIGEFYLRIGDTDNAVKALREGEKFNAKQRITYEERAIEALLQRGKASEAIADVERLYKSAPSDSGVVAFRAMLLAYTDPRQVNASIATLESVVAKLAQDPLIHYYLGRAYDMKGGADNLAKARSNLEMAARLRPDFLPARIMLAQVQLQQRDGQAAAQTSADVLRRDPINLDARLTHARAMSNIGESQKAREDLQIALALYRNSIQARLGLAALDLAEKRFAEAEKGFQEVMQAGDPRGAVGLADLAVAQGRTESAIKALEQECARFPGSYDCAARLAALEFNAGRNAEATAQYERLIQMRPNSAEVYVGLGTAQSRQGNAAGALSSFRKALRIDPSNVNAALGVAVLLDASGQKTEAAAAYERVLQLDSSRGQALNNLAYIKAEQGTDLDRAVALSQRAVQGSPKNASYLDTLGYVYYKHGLIREALDVLEPLVRNNPKNASFHLHLAMALYAASKKEMAGSQLKLASLNGPSEAEQAQIRQLAAKLDAASRAPSR